MSDIPREIVIASNESTRRIHRDLFRFPDESYILIDSDPFAGLFDMEGSQSELRIHLALNWPDMIRLATGRERPGKGDIILLMKKVGLSVKELQPFNDPMNELMAFLYYGKRFDILRRLCAETKKTVERNIKASARINCHLIYEEVSAIIASSL